jgi:hypothetical protein
VVSDVNREANKEAPRVRQTHDDVDDGSVGHRDVGRLPDLGLRQDCIVGNRSTRALSRSGGLEMMPDLHSSAPKMIADGVTDTRMPMQKRYISPLLTNSTLVKNAGEDGFVPKILGSAVQLYFNKSRLLRVRRESSSVS